MASPHNKIRRIRPRNSPLTSKRTPLVSSLLSSPLVEQASAKREAAAAATFTSPLVQVSTPPDSKVSRLSTAINKHATPPSPARRKDGHHNVRSSSISKNNNGYRRVEQRKEPPTPPKPITQQESILSLSVLGKRKAPPTPQSSSEDSDDHSNARSHRKRHTTTKQTPTKASNQGAILSLSTLKKQPSRSQMEDSVVAPKVKITKKESPVKLLSGSLHKLLGQSIPGRPSYKREFTETNLSTKTIRGTVLKHAFEIMEEEADTIFPNTHRYPLDRHKDKILQVVQQKLRHKSLSRTYQRHKLSAAGGMQETNQHSKTLSKLKLQTSKLEELLEQEQTYHNSLRQEEAEYKVHALLLQTCLSRAHKNNETVVNSGTMDDCRPAPPGTMQEILTNMLLEPQQTELP